MRRVLHRIAGWITGQRRKRQEPPCLDWLAQRTGYDTTTWVLLVQDLIQARFVENPDDPDHPFTDPREWMEELSQQIHRCSPQGDGYDENIWHGQVMAMIVATWASRLARAKAMDPRRPVRLRRAAYRKWWEFTVNLEANLVDESLDPDMFPDQPWESPWLKDATDGSFV
jgi:hypothetical protein